MRSPIGELAIALQGSINSHARFWYTYVRAAGVWMYVYTCVRIKILLRHLMIGPSASDKIIKLWKLLLEILAPASSFNPSGIGPVAARLGFAVDR